MSYGIVIKAKDIKTMPWIHLDEYYHLVDKNLAWMLKEITDNITDDMNELFGIKVKTHYHMCSGNYSYLFLTPRVLNVFQREFPCVAVHMKLFEFRDFDAIADGEQDCIFTSRSVEKLSEEEFLTKIKKCGYGAVRGSIADASYFCASQDAVNRKGDKSKALQELDLLYGRIFQDSTAKKEIKYPYRTKPDGRENEDYKIISDEHYLSHLFMLNGVGIWITFDTAPYNSNIVKLAKIPSSDMKRYCIFKDGEFIVASKVKKCLKRLIEKELPEDAYRQKKEKRIYDKSKQ